MSVPIEDVEAAYAIARQLIEAYVDGLVPDFDFAVAPPVTTHPMAYGPGPSEISSGNLSFSDQAYQDRYLRFSTPTSSNLVENVAISDIDLLNYGPLARFDALAHENLSFQRVRSLNSAPFTPGYGLILIKGLIDGLLVEDAEWSGGTPAQETIEAVFRVGGANKDPEVNGGTNLTFRRLKAQNALTVGADYENMDFMAIEGGYVGGLIEQVDFDTASDAGIDLKGDDWRIHLARIASCRQSIKLWGSSDRHGAIETISPVVAHILIADATTNRFEFVRALGSDLTRPLVQFENAVSHITIDQVDLQPGQRILLVGSETIGSTVTIEGTTYSNNSAVWQ